MFAEIKKEDYSRHELRAGLIIRKAVTTDL